MSKHFTKVYGEALWRSKRFLGASDKAKLLFVYFLSNSHSNSIGPLFSTLSGKAK